MPMLAIKGHDSRIFPHGSNGSFDPDVVFYARVGDPNDLAQMKAFQAAGKRVVHDFDDCFHYLPPSNPCASMYGTGKPATKIFEEAIRIADVVTCSTQGLADEYAKFRSEFNVIPNAVWPAHLEAFDRPITGEPKREGQIRIGYAGSDTHNADVAMIAKPLRKIMQKYPQVKVVSIMQPMMVEESLLRRCEFHKGIVSDGRQKPEEYMAAYHNLLDSMDFDIALAPLQSSTFNRCKSICKILEYSLANIPVVASRFGPYAPYTDVLRCSDDRQWFSALEMLIESAEMRATLAYDSRYYIRRNCTIANTLPLWEKALVG